MYAYKIFLPSFGKAEVNKASDFLKKKNIHLLVDPTTNLVLPPPCKGTLLVSLKIENNPKWPYQEKAIVSGFDLEIKEFDLDRALKKSGKNLGNLFGLRPGNPNDVDFEKALAGKDRGLTNQLKTMNIELNIFDNVDIFAGYYTSMLFTCALARSAGGIIFEGAFIPDGDVERDFMPQKEDLESVLEDIEDGESPEFFKGWL